MQALRLKRVTVNTGGISLLKAISVDVNSGEILGIIGANGSGKTTLLRAISFDLEPTSGSISIAGKPIKEIDAQQRARQLAVLPQLSALNFPFTVEEVVVLGRIPHSTGSKCDRHIVKQVLHAMNILHLRERLYTHLSGGERQRVQLARTMAQIWRNADTPEARLLLLDEPTSALDLGHQQQLMHTVRSLADKGVTVVMAIHDINLVARHADNILALSNGHAIAYGRPKDIIKAEVIKKLYAVNVSVVNHPDDNSPVVISS